MVSDFEERACEMFLKSHDMLEVMEGLRPDKAALEVRLLGQLEELKKVLDDISELHERVASDKSEIASLRAQIDWECFEKLELKHKIRRLEKDLERCEGDIKERRTNVER